MAVLAGVSTGYTSNTTGLSVNRVYLKTYGTGTTVAQTGTAEKFAFMTTAAGDKAIAYVTDASNNVLWQSAEFTVASGLNEVAISPGLALTVDDEVHFGLWINSAFSLQLDDSGTWYFDYQSVTYGGALPDPINPASSSTISGHPLIWLEDSGTPTTTAGISTKTLERLGVGVSATAADVFVWAGHNVDMKTTAATHSVLGATITSGVLQEIDLSSTAIAVGGNITVVVIPASGGPGIAIETTAEDIA